MVLGCYYLTLDNPNYLKSNNHYFSNFNDAILAYEEKKIYLHTLIWIPIKDINNKNILTLVNHSESQIQKYTNSKYLLTTVGRILINKIISKNLQI
jgi:DNA-directed RNA polymerase subunit beta'